MLEFETLTGRTKIACYVWAARQFIVDLFAVINGVANTSWRAVDVLPIIHCDPEHDASQVVYQPLSPVQHISRYLPGKFFLPNFDFRFEISEHPIAEWHSNVRSGYDRLENQSVVVKLYSKKPET